MKSNYHAIKQLRLYYTYINVSGKARWSGLHDSNGLSVEYQGGTVAVLLPPPPPPVDCTNMLP